MSEEEKEKALDDIFEQDISSIRKQVTSLMYLYDNALGELVKQDKLIDKLKNKLEQERKLTNLIIDDFQAENYFINMTNKEVREYYSKRKELK